MERKGSHPSIADRPMPLLPFRPIWIFLLPMKKKKGFEYCAICENEYHISDPQIFAINSKKQLCRACWSFVSSETSWGYKKIPKIIFEYIKVPIKHSLKWEVWKRDNFTCKHCGTQENLSVDHITPESYGGTLALSNLQTLCRSCNSRKSNTL